MNKIEFINNLLSILTVVAQILILLLIFFPNSKISKYLKTKALKISFLVALIATLGSLFYSEIAGYTPCLLCWYQRIFMYPLTILFAISLYIKDKTIAIYALSLSVVGSVLALFHYYLQLSDTKLTSCSTVGYSVSCSDNFVMQLGYITIPLMALTAFMLIVLLMFSIIKHK